jgi:hypothetical protein
MSNKNIDQFIATYGPVAQQVSKEINVDPNVLLSQWGLESRWGQTEMAKKYHNLGGIKDFSGAGFEAKDNKTGSKDKYVQFEDPEVFGMYYADQIKRNFPNAVNTGPDIGAFTRGLASGKKGSYYEITPQEYEKTLTSSYSAIPEKKLLPFEPTKTEAKPAEADGDMVTTDAPPPPPPPPPNTDVTGASKGERFLGGTAGAGVGTLATGAQGISSMRTTAAAKRAGAEETARLAAQRNAAAAASAAPPSAAPPSGAKPPLGSTIMRPPSASPTGFNLQPPVGPADAGRMAQGQTGVIPYNTAKALGLTDIEAAKALTNTKQEGGAWDLATKRSEAMNKVQNLFPGEKFVENPRYGGLLTLDQSVGSGPRESFSMKAPVAPSPDLPQGQAGGLSQLPPRQPVSTIPIPPKGPSGLETVTNMFKGMMLPVTSAVKTVGKYALPPLAGLSAGLDLAEMGHEYNKPKDQRDYTKMGLKAASAIGGGLSMFPPTAVVGIPLSLGATAADLYRDNPEYFKEKMKEYTGYSP